MDVCLKSLCLDVHVILSQQNLVKVKFNSKATHIVIDSQKLLDYLNNNDNAARLLFLELYTRNHVLLRNLYSK